MINEWKYIVIRFYTPWQSFVGVTDKRNRVDDGGRKDSERRRLNGFIWENDNKCCKLSHFLLVSLTLLRFGAVLSVPRHNADSLEASKNYVRISKVMGAFSDFIEMLYIFHSASNLCLLLHIASQDMCRHLKRRLAFLLVVSDFY
jgi:hypothetical protein